MITSDKKKLFRQIHKISGGMKKYGKKYKYQFANVCRLMGICRWLYGKKRTAFRWWKKGLKQAEVLDLQVEIGRTNHEIGRRIREWGRSTSIFENKPAAYFLDTAKNTFHRNGIEGAMETINILP